MINPKPMQAEKQHLVRKCDFLGTKGTFSPMAYGGGRKEAYGSAWVFGGGKSPEE